MEAGMTVNAREFLGETTDPVSILNEEDGLERVLTWPDIIGSGCMNLHKIRPGLNLGVARFTAKEALTINYDQMKMPLTIGFCLQGKADYRYRDLENSAYSIGFDQSGMIGYKPTWGGTSKYPAGTAFKYVTLYIDPQLCDCLQPDDSIGIPEDFQELINGDLSVPFFSALTNTPAIVTAIHQVLNCPCQGKMKQLFLEAKSLELISYTLEQLVVDPAIQNPRYQFRPFELEKIRHAGELLCINLEQPPTLNELTRQVGINRDKLNRGFRYLFGASAFEYLRIKRLEKARSLLTTKDMNVSEVAFDVGYNHPKNFTRAFKQYFGVNPTDFLR